MYQVLVGIAYGVFWLLHLVGTGISLVQFSAFQSLLLFAAGVKFLLGISLTLQIYLLAVIQKNVPKLELVYVTISLLVPLALAAAYGVVNYMLKCGDKTAFYVDITILGLSAILLVAACVCSLLVLLLVVRRIFHGRRMSVSSHIERQYVKVICEMLPLFAYLLIFLVQILGLMAALLYIMLWHNYIERAQTVLESSWGLVASTTFAVHLAVVLYVRKFCVKVSIGKNAQQYGTIIDNV